MSNQYFENNPNLKSEIHEIKHYFKGKEITFYSDNGVFSKGSIDFGSALLLKNVKANDGDKLLDVGCGYGTIGVTLALYFPNINVDMVDVNERALGLTKMAIEKNNVKNANVFESNIYENVTNVYNVIVSNPPIRAGKKVVHSIILDAYDHLVENGVLYIVIRKEQGAESALKALINKYKTSEIIDKENGYWIIQSTK